MHNLSKKYLALISLGILAIIVVGILTPLVINHKYSTWNEEYIQIKESIVENIQKTFSEKESKIISASSKLKEEISTKNITDDAELLGIINSDNYSGIEINIFKNNKLIAWNRDRIISNKKLDLLTTKNSTKETFILNTPLFFYLAKINFVDNYSILTVVPIKKRYRLAKAKADEIDFISKVEQEFNTKITIEFEQNFTTHNSIEIKNSNGSTIAWLKIGNISRDAEIARLKKNLELLQSILALITLIFILLWINEKIKSRNEHLKIFFIIFSILITRYFFLWLNISDLIGFSELINPIYFSSTFGNGLTKSPLDLFITILSIFIIVINIYKYFIKLSSQNFSKGSSLALFLFMLTLFVLLYNGFASTIRSVIFDSSILYFKDAKLFESNQTSFMYLNILLVGLITLLFSISIITFLNRLVESFYKTNKFLKYFLLFLILTSLLIFDEIIFSKSSIFSVTIYSILIFLISYYWLYHKNGKYTSLLILLLTSSILSISFLNFFNSELERKSLKTIANALTRSNTELYEYYVDKSCDFIKNKKELINLFPSDTDFDKTAFALWTNTDLPFEIEGSALNIIDSNGNLLGSFNFKYNEPYRWRWDKPTSIQKRVNVDKELGIKTIFAIVPILKDTITVGYIELTAQLTDFTLNLVDKNRILGSLNATKSISINPDLLKIFEFQNGELINYFTNVFLNNYESSLLINAVPQNKTDVWLNVKIDDENNLFYIKKISNSDENKILAVGLRDQDITWSLYNFFKVFFIHSIMILLFVLLLVLIDFRKWKEIQISFKTKILFSLLIISIIPLVLLAVYFKGISEEKNNKAINYKLGKRADNVEEYINNYVNTSTLTEEAIFEKAVRDLGIEFSLFKYTELLFSSEGNYYKAGILPKLINPLAYLSLQQEGISEVIIKENFESIKFNALYHRAIIAGEEYVIKISDVFNTFQLPLSGIELNVFLFGTYSLAIILIVILSTLLANQISSPIEKLTKATRSVSFGDMDIQIESSESGEVKELIDGFNLMVRELKKNQVELAEVERELAWREMAKQVAHEIKNPLTPMKLAIQHLVIAHQDKSDKFDSIFKKVTDTIINQIDILKNIASEFSSFAKMPSIKLEEIDLVNIAQSIKNLFIEENCKITVHTKEDSITLKSDKEQTERMFVNLVRNSIQAGATEITISLSTNKNKINIEISDNGKGINKEIAQKVFDENFTTKKSGMGLGLSLTRRFLNLIGGKISIKESSSNGTVLLIEIERK